MSEVGAVPFNLWGQTGVAVHPVGAGTASSPQWVYRPHSHGQGMPHVFAGFLCFSHVSESAAVSPSSTFCVLGVNEAEHISYMYWHLDALLCEMLLQVPVLCFAWMISVS